MSLAATGNDIRTGPNDGGQTATKSDDPVISATGYIETGAFLVAGGALAVAGGAYAVGAFGPTAVTTGAAGVGVAKPVIQDLALRQNYVEPLYRQGAIISSGSTADAARQEIAAGLTSGGHIEKAYNYAVGMTRYLDSHPALSADDVWGAQIVIQDMIRALTGD